VTLECPPELILNETISKAISLSTIKLIDKFGFWYMIWSSN
jgi:hypothetical protein